MIEVQVEGIDDPLEFPDGTDPAVIQSTVKKVLAGSAAPVREDSNLIKSPTQPFEGTSGPDWSAFGEGMIALITQLGAKSAGGLAGISDNTRQTEQSKIDPIGAIESGNSRRMTTPNERSQTVGAASELVPTFTPSTEGQAAQEQIISGLETAGDIASLPIVGAEGIATAISTGSTDEAKRAMATMLDQGVSERLAERNFNATGSARAGVAAGLTPDLLGIPAGQTAARAIPKALRPVQEAIAKQANQPDLNVFDETGKFTDEAIDAVANMDNIEELLDQAGDNGAVLSPEQMKRLNLFIDRDITPLKADITRNTEDSINQQQAIKEGGPVAFIAAEQEKQIAGLADSGVEKSGGIVTNAAEAGDSVHSAIFNRADALDKQITASYKAARAQTQGQPVVSMDNLIEAVKANKGRDKLAGGVISSIRQTLKNNGVDGDSPNVTVEIAEEIRQQLNKDYPGANARGRTLIRELKDVIDDSVESAVGVDIFAESRKTKVAFHKALEKAKRDKFDKTKGSLVEDILDNKVEPEKIVDKIYAKGTRSDDVAKLKQFLLEDAGPDGIQAWDDLRSQILQRAIDKAIGTNGVREGGQSVFNVRLFKNELKRIRGNKFPTIFNADERKLISDIETIGNSRLPIAGTATGEGPSAVAVIRTEARQQLLRKVPMIGEGAEALYTGIRNRARDKGLIEFTGPTEKALKK